MKALRLVALLFVFSLGFVIFSRAQGPLSPGSETVARPKKGATGAPPEEAAPKIPSKFSKKDPNAAGGDAVFRTDAITVSVDVSVLDNKGHFIPKIGKEHFRVLEDNVPQQVAGYSLGEAPMTVTMLVEFSNRYQSFYSEAWFQTLAAAY